ncbi:LacI family DNA-binding transcriptional regulator [Bifidobacterium sp. ESL0827]|uniref:LacI family DNA-binding transcriptional regulator n=1 Tax=Bifidobacterium sp. ESL0827 TaxID=3448583 RepID=UPI00404285A1
MSKATIADIAREAGVSVTTVSRFINGNYRKMSPATRLRIQATVNRLDYTPRASARQLRRGQSMIVGVIVGDISNVFSSLLFKGIYNVLQPSGYDIMLMNSNNSVDQEKDEIERLLSQQVDGLIIQPNACYFEAYKSISTAHLPLVMVDRLIGDQPHQISQVASDNFDSCFSLGSKLLSGPYRKVVVLSRVLSQVSAQTIRAEGFERASQALKKKYVRIEMGDHDGSWLSKQIRKEIADMAEDGNTGKTLLVSLMGPLLFETLASLRELGLVFPRDLGLVSFDDWDWSQYVENGIYLLEQDPKAMGEQAASNLCLQMKKAKAGRDPYGVSKSYSLPVKNVPAPSV